MHKQGFSLVEIVVVVSLAAFLFALGIPAYNALQYRNATSLTGDTLVDMIERARLFSMVQHEGSAWGVSVSGRSATLFKGDTFAVRDSTHDDVYAFEGGISVSGLEEVTFSPLTGIPSATGTIMISHTQGAIYAVTIESTGALTFE